MDHEIVIVTSDPDATSAWFCENLFFDTTEEKLLHNGSCNILVKAGTPCQAPVLTKGQYIAGVTHLALRTDDIHKALDHCKAKGLELILDDGHAFFNPKVYGSGEHYFNIKTPFGVLVEISQHVDACEHGDQIICGLDHVGLPSIDFEAQLANLKGQGFEEEFSPIVNHNDAEGTIKCCMVRREKLILEVYQFLDMEPMREPANAPLQLYGVDTFH